MGAPFGNQNNRKGILWNQALERALAKRGKGDMIAALDDLAEKFLDAAEEMSRPTPTRGPSIAGFSELADRLDGRAKQSVDLTAEITDRAALMSDDALAGIASAGTPNPT